MTTVDHHPLLDAIHSGEPGAVRQEALAHPNWPHTLSPQRCPLMRVFMLYDEMDGRGQALRELLVQALLAPLEPGALRHLNEPLWTAAQHDWSHLMPMLLPFCDPNGVKDRCTPLGLAARHGHMATLQALIPVSSPLPEGTDWTPLMHAAQHNRTQAMQLLLKMPGLDPNHADREGRTALHWAAIEDRDEAVMLLLDHGANPNLQDEIGWTPLMLALTSGDGALAKKMLERDPVAAERGLPLLDLQRLDNEGFSLLDMALSYQHEAPEIATLIGVTQQRQDDAVLRKTLTATLDTPVLATPLRVRSRL